MNISETDRTFQTKQLTDAGWKKIVITYMYDPWYGLRDYKFTAQDFYILNLTLKSTKDITFDVWIDSITTSSYVSKSYNFLVEGSISDAVYTLPEKPIQFCIGNRNPTTANISLSLEGRLEYDFYKPRTQNRTVSYDIYGEKFTPFSTSLIFIFSGLIVFSFMLIIATYLTTKRSQGMPQ